LPPVFSFPILVVLSPEQLRDRELRDTLDDYWGVKHYMPIPTEEEVLALREVASPHVNVEGVHTRMQLWGPIPRHVLVNISPLLQQELKMRSGGGFS
jgi:hypothetical protein